jgi:RNA-binding motif protein, X-linked 2
MYEDQRSTVLAVDNLNGATVLDRTLRVDHVKNYKQPRIKGGDGEWKEREEQSLNAKPEMIGEYHMRSYILESLMHSSDDPGSESSASSAPNIDPDDPMRDYLLDKWRAERAKKKGKKTKSRKHKDETTPEERRERKERKKEKRAKREASKSEGLRGVEALLKSLDRRGEERSGRRSPSNDDRLRSRSRSPPRRRVRDDSDDDGGRRRDYQRRR